MDAMFGEKKARNLKKGDFFRLADDRKSRTFLMLHDTVCSRKGYVTLWYTDISGQDYKKEIKGDQMLMAEI